MQHSGEDSIGRKCKCPGKKQKKENENEKNYDNDNGNGDDCGGSSCFYRMRSRR